jgi:heat shock protein HslJ
MSIRSAGRLAMAALLTLAALGGAITACASKHPTTVANPSTPSPSQLQAFEWTLDAANDGQGQAMTALFPRSDRRFLLVFTPDRLAIRGGCNGLGGAYQTSNRGAMQVGPLMGTRRGCEAPLMQADNAITAVFALPLQLQLDEGTHPTLRVVSSQGHTLVWTGASKP